MLRLKCAPPSRSQARRSLHVATHTLSRPTPATLASHIASQPATPGSAILYTLHPDLPDLGALVKTFQSLQIPSVGSIALAPPGNDPCINIVRCTPTTHSERLTTFHAPITGRPAAQVGKWQRDPLMHARKVGKGKREEDRKGEEVGEMERVMLGLGASGGAAEGSGARVMGWDALWRSGRDGAGDSEPLPRELQGLEDVQTMLLLADGQPDALLRMLNTRYPDVQKVCLHPAFTSFKLMESQSSA